MNIKKIAGIRTGFAVKLLKRIQTPSRKTPWKCAHEVRKLIE